MATNTEVITGTGEEGSPISSERLNELSSALTLWNEWVELSEIDRTEILCLANNKVSPEKNRDNDLISGVNQSDKFINLQEAEAISRALSNVNLSQCVIAGSSADASPAAPQNPSGSVSTGETTTDTAPETPGVGTNADKGTLLNPYTFGQILLASYNDFLNRDAVPDITEGTWYINANGTKAQISSNGINGFIYLLRDGVKSVLTDQDFVSRIKQRYEVRTINQLFGSLSRNPNFAPPPDSLFDTADMLRLILTAVPNNIHISTDTLLNWTATLRHESAAWPDTDNPNKAPRLSYAGIVSTTSDTGLTQVNGIHRGDAHMARILGVSVINKSIPTSEFQAALSSPINAILAGLYLGTDPSGAFTDLTRWNSWNNRSRIKEWGILREEADHAIRELVHQIAAVDAARQPASN